MPLTVPGTPDRPKHVPRRSSSPRHLHFVPRWPQCARHCPQYTLRCPLYAHHRFQYAAMSSTSLGDPGFRLRAIIRIVPEMLEARVTHGSGR